MGNIKRLLNVAIGLIAAAACLLFVLENQQQVVISFLGWTTPQWPVSQVAVLALLAGMAVGSLIGWVVAAKGRRRVRRAELAQQIKPQ